MTKLYIDDIRDPVSPGWVVARSSKEAIDHVKEYGVPNFISFDHDLGGTDTSRLFVNWLVDQLIDETVTLPEDFQFSVHSANPVGSIWISETMTNVVKHFKGK